MLFLCNLDRPNDIREQMCTSCLEQLKTNGTGEQKVTSFMEELKTNCEKLENLHTKEVFNNILNTAPEHLIGAIAHRKVIYLHFNHDFFYSCSLH